MIDATIAVVKQTGLLTLFVVAFVYIRHFASPLSQNVMRDIYSGLLFGGLIAISMLDPLIISGGAVMDARGGPAILSAILAGPLAAMIAAVIGALVRYFVIGGPVALGGAVSFALYAAFSIVAATVIKRRQIDLTVVNLAVLGALGAAAVLPAFFVSVDAAAAIAVLKEAGPIFLGNNVLSTLVVGTFIVQGSRLLTYSQRLESEIRENTKLARITHVSTNSVIITDKDGYAEWANKGFERLTGYAVGDLIGKKPGDLLQGPATDPATVAHIAAQLAKGEGFQVEILNYTKSRTPYWVAIDCQPYRDVDGEKKFMAIEADVSKRREFADALAKKQQELELALHNIPGALVYTDDDLKIAFCSEKMPSIYGVPEALLSPGAYYPDFLQLLAARGDYGEGDVDELVAPRIASLRAPSDQMYIDRLPDRKIYGVRRTKAPSGGTLTVISDMTEQVLLNERLASAIAAAEEASKSKSEFLASMSHEIRTPMTGIMGFADQLLNDDLSSEAKDKVEKIKKSATSLLTILNDILDLSKLDAGKLDIENVNFNPAKIANEVTHLFYETCPPDKKASLIISAGITDDFPAVVCADPTRLRQVLVNLMGNAVKFSESGSVTLYCEKVAAANMMRFKVVDTGIGIRQEDQAKLFGDFVQADASVSRKYHGTGLGLSICRRLVSLMGGKIGFESVPGKGTTFWFELPYTPTPEGEEIIDDGVILARKFVGARALSILVAEDNEINQAIIENILSQMGHECTIVNNGVKAVEAVKDADFDLVLMDVRMPELSGPDAAMTIRQLPGFKGAVPIIALTADVMADSRQTYVDAGMNGCVAKPIDVEQLALAINKAIGEIVNMIVTDDKQTRAKSSLDIEEAKSRLGLSEDFIGRLLRKFASDYGDVAAQLEAFVAVPDLNATRELAHTLKGVTGTLGMPELSECASEIEIAAKSGDADAAAEKIRVLSGLVQAATASIEDQFGVASV